MRVFIRDGFGGIFDCGPGCARKNPMGLVYPNYPVRYRLEQTVASAPSPRERRKRERNLGIVRSSSFQGARGIGHP